MLGTGLTMEGVFQNAATFDLMNEMAHRAEPGGHDWLLLLRCLESYRYSHSAVRRK